MHSIHATPARVRTHTDTLRMRTSMKTSSPSPSPFSLPPVCMKSCDGVLLERVSAITCKINIAPAGLLPVTPDMTAGLPASRTAGKWRWVATMLSPRLDTQAGGTPDVSKPSHCLSSCVCLSAAIVCVCHKMPWTHTHTQKHTYTHTRTSRWQVMMQSYCHGQKPRWTHSRTGV